jgi:uncharacterized protein YqgC (DUF456 family)
MPDWLEAIIIVLTQLIILIGLVSLLVPIFPGITVIWLAVLGYGIVTGFGTLGVIIFVLITLLMLAGTLGDNLLMGAGARKGGASWITIGVALLAGVLGTIVFPPIGGLIAAPLAVFALEYLRVRDVRGAWYALRGLAAGWGLSFFARFGIGVVMMVLWWIWVWQG